MQVELTNVARTQDKIIRQVSGCPEIARKPLPIRSFGMIFVHGYGHAIRVRDFDSVISGRRPIRRSFHHGHRVRRARVGITHEPDNGRLF
jgi:hypothetical protein